MGLGFGAPSRRLNSDLPIPFRRLLIARLSALGDVICVLPALDALRASFPEARIGFLVEDRAHELIAGHPAVDRVHLYPRKRWQRSLSRPAEWPESLREIRAFVREMREESYDVVLELQGNIKGAALSLLSGAKLRVGFSGENCREGSHLISHRRIPVLPQPTHLVDKFLAAAAYLGADPSKARFRLPDSPDSRSRVEDFLRSQGLGPYAVIHPSTSHFGKRKRWPPERFSRVAEKLGSELKLPAVIIWGPGEEALASRVAGDAGKTAVLSFRTSLLDLAELLRRAEIFVGADSGPLHLATAVGTPSAALFGPMDPRIYAPWHHPQSRILYKPGTGGVGNVDAIAVEDVLKACRDLLEYPGYS